MLEVPLCTPPVVFVTNVNVPLVVLTPSPTVPVALTATEAHSAESVPLNAFGQLVVLAMLAKSSV